MKENEVPQQEGALGDIKELCYATDTNGISSPILYYMLLNRMDWAVLASAMHRWQWIIKRHAKPSVFKKLSAKTLQQYAEVFNITVDELCKFSR